LERFIVDSEFYFLMRNVGESKTQFKIDKKIFLTLIRKAQMNAWMPKSVEFGENWTDIKRGQEISAKDAKGLSRALIKIQSNMSILPLNIGGFTEEEAEKVVDTLIEFCNGGAFFIQ